MEHASEPLFSEYASRLPANSCSPTAYAHRTSALSAVRVTRDGSFREWTTAACVTRPGSSASRR